MTQILPLIKRIAQNSRDRYGDVRTDKFFVFTLSRKPFAIPAVDVTEVAAPSSLISIPQNSELIKGVVNIRGTIVPVINLRSRLSLDASHDINENSRMIVFKLNPGAYLAMIADDIEYRLRDGIMQITDDNLAPDEKFFRTVEIGNQKLPVFMVEKWLETTEIETLLKIVESY